MPATHRLMEIKIDNDSDRPRMNRPVISDSVWISPTDAALIIAAIHKGQPVPMDEKAWMIDVLTYGSKEVLEAAA